jgi:hypothetical protein
MQVSESTIVFLEKNIPELASGACKQAYARALASGSSVLEVRDGLLVESYPDGSVHVLKTLHAIKKVRIGKRRINK